MLEATREAWYGRWLSPEAPLYVIAIFICAVIVALTLVVFWATFVEGLPSIDAAYTLQNYQDALLAPSTWSASFNSLAIGAGTVLVNFFFAIPIAWFVQRTSLSCKEWYITLMLVAGVIPGFLKAIAWIFLLSPHNGLINQWVRQFVDVERGPFSIYNIAGIAFVQGLMLTPLMFFMVGVAFQKIDNQFEEVGEVSGANAARVFRRITAPLVIPAIAAAAIYNFMTAIAIFEIPALLGFPGQIYALSTRIYQAVNTDLGLPQYGIAGIYGLIMLIPSLVMLHFYQKMLRQSHKYSVISGKNYKAKLIDIGRWAWFGHAFVWLFFSLSFVLPLIVLVWSSLVPYIALPTAKSFALVNLNAYKVAIDVFTGEPFLNTLKLVLVVSVAVTVFSTILSWVVQRTKLPGRYAMDTIAMLPHSIPNLAFAFALGFIALLFARVLPLYGSLAIIMIAHVVAYISLGTRMVNGALIQIHLDLENAALVCGASPPRVIQKIVLPLLLPSLAYTAIWVALLSYRETTMAIFLQRPDNVVLSSKIWELWMGTKTSEASAAGVIMVATLMVLFFVMLKVGNRLGMKGPNLA
ncbi:MAG: ABC transporter permease [Burkholderiales bacterium]